MSGFRLSVGICVDIDECGGGGGNDVDDYANDAEETYAICGAYGECVNHIGLIYYTF
jgi:hypothetical protein